MLSIQGRSYNNIISIVLTDKGNQLTTDKGIIVPIPDTIHISDLITLIEDIDSIEDTLNDLEPIKDNT